MTRCGLLWAAGIALVLITGLVMAGEWLIQAGLPAQRAAFEWVAPDFKVLLFELDREKADQVLRVWVSLGRYTFVGSHLVEPDPRGVAQASTVALQGLQGPLLAIWASLVWPARVARTRALRLLLCLPAAIGLWLFDSPLVLAASLWQFLVDAYAPGSTQPLLLARDVLQGGGRFVIGLAVGAAAGIAIGDPEQPDE
jgi:hypothetical protein